METSTTQARPGEGLKTEKMPGHWVLARLGKRVLRPGGMELTHLMLKRLAIRPADEVIEFAPGMGTTARLTLALAPSSYTAVERDEAAAKIVGSYLAGHKQKCVVGSASETGLPDQSGRVWRGDAHDADRGGETEHSSRSPSLAKAWRALRDSRDVSHA